MICYNNSCSVSERNQSSAEGKTLSNPQVLVHTVYPKKYAHGFCFAVLCCGYTLTDFPISSGLLHCHCGNLAIAPVPAKQPWWIWINTSCEFIMNHCITTKKSKAPQTVCIFLGIYCISRHLSINDSFSALIGLVISFPSRRVLIHLPQRSAFSFVKAIYWV